MVTLPSHLRTLNPTKPDSNVQYIHLSFSMPIESVLKVDMTNAAVPQKFAISNIYDSSFGLNCSKGGKKPYFKAAKII